MNPEVREAATVVVVRDTDTTEGYEVFMLKRPGRGTFPDLHVFPGGKVDAEDKRLADHLGLTGLNTRWPQDVEPRFLITAIRECFEECGVLLAHGGIAEHGADRLADARELLLGDALNFDVWMIENDLTFDLQYVHYFSHWITPKTAPARFNTRFFIAEMPPAQNAVRHAKEAVRGEWVSPSLALRKHALGEWQMIVPTITTLRMITGYDSVAHLIETVEAGEHRIPVTAALHEQGMQYYLSS